MASPDYADSILSEINSFASSYSWDGLSVHGAMKNRFDNVAADHFSEMFTDQGDSMYMSDDGDEISSIFAHLSPAEREELIRQYQHYQQVAHSDQEFFDEMGYNGYPGDEMGYYGDEAGYYDGEIEDDYGPGYYYDEDEYYGDYYGDGEGEEYMRISLSELCDRCVFPTLAQAVYTLYPLLGLCLFMRLLVYFTSDVLHGLGGWARTVQHASSAVCGLLVMWLFFEETLIYLLLLALLAYALLYATRLKCQRWSGTAVAIVTMVYLVTCELFVVQKIEWHRIRGAQMVLSMKIISLAFDLDARTLHELPSPLEYLGYVFQVGTVIFGPWISFTEYTNSLLYKDRKITFYWFVKCVWSALCSLLCVVVSTCVIHWLILDEQAFVWLLAYRDAQSFRFSHYFVSYASELTATLCGLGATRANNDVRWDLVVSRPLQIELPRSLVDVVANWNLPMHHWLKTYVFKTAKPLSNFAAIVLTYAASALLHGLNFQLAAVLLSLGFYSYVEYVLRQWLSRVYDACIQAKACKEHCDHVYTRLHPYVMALNVALGCLAAFHLAYLGLMFDNSPDQDQGYTMSHTLAKWGYLGYASHWVMLVTYVFYLLI